MINVRKGKLDDMEAVWELVRELAIFEKEPDAVITTPKSFARDFKAGYFDLLIAEDSSSNDLAGIMLYYDAFSTWKGRMIYLEDFYVKQSFRRLGIGSKLFDALVAEAAERQATLIKWQVLDWNEGALNFYKDKNAIVEKNWWNCKYFLK